MSWKDVGQAVIDKAPLLGALLGGPAGGAVGSIISAAFGTEPEPGRVLDAIQADPAAAARIREIEADHEAELRRLALEAEANRLAEETARIVRFTASIRAETRSERWYSAAWRPYWGFASGTAFIFVCVLVCYLAYQAVVGGRPEAMVMVPQVIGAFAGLFAIPGAVLGVTAWHRGKRQRIEAGEQSAPGVLGAIAERIRAR